MRRSREDAYELLRLLHTAQEQTGYFYAVDDRVLWTALRDVL